MDAHFLTYVTNFVNKKFEGERRQSLLVALRDDPDKVTRFVHGNIHNWNLFCEAASGTGAVVEIDFAVDPPLVTRHFRQHFAKEIEALPASQPT